jgi:hypothetical protein
VPVGIMCCYMYTTPRLLHFVLWGWTTIRNKKHGTRTVVESITGFTVDDSINIISAQNKNSNNGLWCYSYDSYIA